MTSHIAAHAVPGDDESIDSDPLSSVRRFSAVNRGSLWPAGTGGNQIFTTSRVAGYRAVPLRGDTAHYTISEMSDSAIKGHLGRWFYAVGRAVQRYEATNLYTGV